MSWVNLSYILSQFLKLVLCPFSNFPKNVSSAGHLPVTSRTCPGRLLKMSLSWPFWDISKNVLSQSVLCPLFNFSNLSHVLDQNWLKMCHWLDMSRTRPGRVPDVSSKCPCPEYFGTSPNRTSATKLSIEYWHCWKYSDKFCQRKTLQAAVSFFRSYFSLLLSSTILHYTNFAVAR